MHFACFTDMPLVVCDPETFNDQIWIFDTEEQLSGICKKILGKKGSFKGHQAPRNQRFLSFFSMLFTIGVNELVFVSESGTDRIELAELVKRPDFSQLPKEQQPVSNPELQLTGLYFVEEASRPVPNEQKNLVDLEEELAANLYKAKYMVPIELLEGPEPDLEKLKEKKYRIPILKNKNGDVLQPLFTDPNEFAKFNRENVFKALSVPFANLVKLVIKDSKGFLLNPAGFHIAMPKELLEGLPKRFGAAAPAWVNPPEEEKPAPEKTEDNK